MDAGLGILRWLRSRFPRVPVYLFSETPEKRGLSPEALERVSQEGGAPGILQKRFFGNSEQDALERGSFFRQLDEVIAALRRQNVIERYQRRFTVVEFDLQPNRTPSDDGHLLLELSGMREITAVSAQDREVTGWVDLPRDRFDDIAGAEQAKQRLREVVAWLSDPRPVIDLGLELPKGILLTGPPGTGKTSLARAVAGESQVPFFAISGASVFRKYVGESEAAIRNLFAVARRYAPAVIFIDEIDAIGTQRSDRADHAARVGVLNELLAQMDGFAQGAQPIFVMAATNRPDILDPALVRAGRFDLQVEVPVPNAPAREQILGIYLRGMALAEDVDVTRLAARTIGMSGADIRQVCKEAGFLALREGSPTVTHHHMDEAITVVRFGLSSERMLLDDAAKWSTAVHEAGHALAQHLIFPDEPVTQVSILPRGRSLGFTEHVPGKEYIDQSLGHVRGTVRVLLAGRAAEEIMLGDDGITSGCADDLARASALVLRMVSAWGMDEEVGLLSLPGVRQGLSVAEGVPLRSAHHEEAIAASRRWLTQEAAAVRKLLKEHKDALRRIAEAVAAQETLGEKELRPLLASQPTKEIEHGHDPQGNR
jgi:cell division protease FtsH